jgi:dihydroxy-acid dehydratase
LNASPEAAAGGNLAVLKDGDRLRIDLRKRRVNILISDEEIAQRRKDLGVDGYTVAPSGTPWQELFRQETAQLSEGMVMKKAVKFQRLAQEGQALRHNH